MKNVFGDELCKSCGSVIKKNKCTYPECKSNKKSKKGDK
jgi:RNA polymerase subunit RPABC4/transcription elongation factor Spt4